MNTMTYKAKTKKKQQKNPRVSALHAEEKESPAEQPALTDVFFTTGKLLGLLQCCPLCSTG